MKLQYCLLALLWPALNGFTQSPLLIRPLAIGDSIPDLSLAKVYNSPVSKIQLPGFNNKLTILDFWASWCGACVGSFSHLQSLQDEFADEIRILLVNSDKGDDENKINSFFLKRKERTGKTFELPYLLQDTLLRNLFPHRSIPHTVWLNNDGKVIAITAKEELTGDNIKDAIAGKTLHLRIKNDELLFNSERPLTVSGFRYRSLLSDYQAGLGSVMGKKEEADGTVSKLYVINHSLLSLYQTAYPGLLNLHRNKILMRVKDITLFDDDKNYCYEITTAPVTYAQMTYYMQEDLYRCFGIRVKKEKRLLSCYVLKTNDKVKNSITNGDPGEVDIEEKTLHKSICNQPVSVVTHILNGVSDKPIIDESGILKNIDLVFPQPSPLNDIKQLRLFLNEKGFDLIPTKRMIEVAVIYDK